MKIFSRASVQNSEQGAERIIKLMPKDAAKAARRVHETLKKARTGIVRYKTAAENLRPLDEALLAHPRCGALMIFRGFVKRVANRYEDAAAEISRGIALHPEEPQGHFWLATALGALGRFADAVESLDRAVGLAPECAEYYKLRGQAQEKLGRLEAAVSDFDKAIACRQNYDWAYIGHGVCQARLGRLDEALDDLDKAIELSQQEEWAFLKRSLIRRRLGDILGAVEDVNRACDLNPTCEWVQGKMPKDEKALLEANGLLDGCLAEHPEAVWARAWRGQTRLKLGDFAGARQDLERALSGELGKRRAWALAWRGESARRLGDLDQAEKDLDQAAAERPDYPQAFLWRGCLRLERGRPEPALVDFKRSAELNDRFPEIHFFIGRALEALGRSNEALASYDEGLKIGPGNGELLKARAALRGRQGDAVGQEEDLRQYYEKISVSPQYWRGTYGELIDEAGPEVAGRVWESLPLPAQLLREDAREAAAALLALRGANLRQAGRLDEALASFKEALRLKARPIVSVDARIELLAAVQGLIEPGPLPAFLEKSSPDVLEYARESRRRFAAFSGDPALAAVRGSLQEPAAFRWFQVAGTLLKASALPRLEWAAVPGPNGRDAALLGALRSLAERSRFLEFFDPWRERLSRWAAPVREALAGEDYSAGLSCYLGVEVKADFIVMVSPLAFRTSYSDQAQRPGGRAESWTVICPSDPEAGLWDGISPVSRPLFQAKAWHELSHAVMDAWAEKYAERIGNFSRLHARISGHARRSGWLDCFSEHLVLAPSCRLLRQKEGAGAAEEIERAYLRSGYAFLGPVLKGLEEYEASRERYPSLEDFYPRWLNVLERL
ncbi:MAG: DUF4932 domain-containing protein [Elusimicrobia bacterium]|nr:DUF4932 domain-containing protein [Elusimicrobiota bacterium]